jgi:glucose-1-phosphate cytidylyltransferase
LVGDKGEELGDSGGAESSVRAMKVVIFCGGLGVRMGEETQRIPKPMIRIGNRPILWHIMRYYAAWGHTEFVLCLGYKGDVIKEYFLSHNEALMHDFVLDGYGADAEVEILNRDGGPWRITFADTGTRSTIGERLKLVEQYIGDDEVFMATYGDGLTDVDLPAAVSRFESSGKMIMFALVKPHFHAHIVQADDDGTVRDVRAMDTSGVRINGGFFVMRREIFDWIAPGDELVEETFAKLIPRGDVGAYVHDGFFGPMDTIKDRQWLEGLYDSGRAPWLRVGLDPAESPVG